LKLEAGPIVSRILSFSVESRKILAQKYIGKLTDCIVLLNAVAIQKYCNISNVAIVYVFGATKVEFPS